MTVLVERVTRQESVPEEYRRNFQEIFPVWQSVW